MIDHTFMIAWQVGHSILPEYSFGTCNSASHELQITFLFPLVSFEPRRFSIGSGHPLFIVEDIKRGNATKIMQDIEHMMDVRNIVSPQAMDTGFTSSPWKMMLSSPEIDKTPRVK